MPDDGVKGNRLQTWMTYESAKNNELNNKVLKWRESSADHSSPTKRHLTWINDLQL